jgi:hypothetical protein
MQWNISQIDQAYKDGKFMPSTVHWLCTHTEGEFSGSVYSTAQVSGLADLSLDAVLAHLWANGVDKDATEAACKAQIANQRINSGAVRLSGVLSVPVATVPLEQSKLAALTQIDEHHATVVTKLVGNPTQAEKDTWTLKLETATAVSAGTPISLAGQSFLSAAGIEGTEAQKTWSKSVIGKAAAYAAIVGVGEKLRAHARQTIKAATTTEEISGALEDSILQTEAAVKAFLLP